MPVLYHGVEVPTKDEVLNFLLEMVSNGNLESGKIVVFSYLNLLNYIKETNNFLFLELKNIITKVYLEENRDKARKHINTIAGNFIKTHGMPKEAGLIFSGYRREKLHQKDYIEKNFFPFLKKKLGEENNFFYENFKAILEINEKLN